MAIVNISQNSFIVDLEVERDNTWPDGVQVFCKDTNKTYRLIEGVFIIL